VEIAYYLGNKREVVIPSKIRGIPVITIGAYAFSSEELISVTIPNSVTTIGGWAFDDNYLTSITIGANVVLEDDSFENGFESAYAKAGKAAGTYTRRNTDNETWTKKQGT
jgi:hypothetical protein